jgi:hypothetical protein
VLLLVVQLLVVVDRPDDRDGGQVAEERVVEGLPVKRTP